MHYRFFMSLAYQQSSRAAQKSNLHQTPVQQRQWAWGLQESRQI